MIVVRVRPSPEAEAFELAFDKPEILIGRDPAVSDVLATDGSVSKAHAIIARTSRGLLVTDLGSTNGTRVNGILIVPSNPYLLQASDEVEVGAAGMSLWIVADTTAAPAIPAVPGKGERVSLAATSEGQVILPTAVATKSSAKSPKAAATGEKPTPKSSDGAKAAKADAKPAASKAAAGAPAGGLMAGITALVAAVKEVLPLDPYHKTVRPSAELLKKLDAALAAQAPKLPNVSADLREEIVLATRRELLETGPIGPWLEDPTISRIQCLRHDHIDLTRDGVKEPASVVFSSGASLHRAMLRLAKQSGTEAAKGEVVVERRINNGCRMVALLPPKPETNLLLTIRKRVPVTSALDRLVAQKNLSSGMASFLTRCLEQGVNLLVTGSSESTVCEVVSALASATPKARRLAVLHAGAEIRVEGRKVTSFGLPVAAAEEERALRVAGHMGFDHLFVLSPKARTVASAAAAVLGGGSGLVVGAPLRNLTRALGGGAVELALSRPGLGASEARRLVGHAFEVGVEVTTLADGAPCVRRIAEVTWSESRLALRDLFVVSHSEDRAARVFNAVQPPQLSGFVA